MAGWLGRWEGNREGEWVEGWWMAKMEGRAEMTGVRGWLWFSLPWACLHPPLPTLEPGLHAIAAQSSCSSAPCPPSVQCSESISQPTARDGGRRVPSTRNISSPPLSYSLVQRSWTFKQDAHALSAQGRWRAANSPLALTYLEVLWRTRAPHHALSFPPRSPRTR